MAHRTFRDRAGRTWDVWEVVPTRSEEADGRSAQPAAGARGRESPLPVAMRQGWLAFECKSEKRRLAPIPSGWAEASDAELESLLEQAPIRARPRRLIE